MWMVNSRDPETAEIIIWSNNVSLLLIDQFASITNDNLDQNWSQLILSSSTSFKLNTLNSQKLVLNRIRIMKWREYTKE